MNGFLDQDGNFYECGFERHEFFARKIRIFLGYPRNQRQKPDQEVSTSWGSEERLLELGWIKLAGDSLQKREVLDGSGRDWNICTDHQLAWLRKNGYVSLHRDGKFYECRSEAVRRERQDHRYHQLAWSIFDKGVVVIS